MDLNKLLIFSKVAEFQSFTMAAKELGIEKSTVSSKISELENRLGTRLLNRTTRMVSLTDAGERYYQYCRQIVDTAIEADEFVQTFISEPQGLLRINAPEGIGKILFNDLFNVFLKKYNKINVEVNLGGREVDLIRDHVDLALRIRNTTLKDSSFVSKLIKSVELGFFVSTQYVSDHGDIKHIRQLKEHQFISMTAIKSLDPSGWNKNEDFSLLENRIVINDIDACKSTIKAGLGIGILPLGALRNELADGSIVRIIPDHHLDPILLYAVYPSRQWVSSKLIVFLEFLDQWAEEQIEC